MAISVNATFSDEQRKLEGAYPINMYVVNSSQSGWDPLYYAHHTQDVYGYALTATGVVTATSQLYTAIPINMSDIKTGVAGEIPQVNLSVPNTDRAIEAVIQDQDYLRGREIYMLTAFAKHLPSGATAYHVGSSDDSNAYIKEKLYVDSVTSNEQAVTFVCKPKFVISNILLPRRRYTRECSWNYLGTECDPNSSILSATYATCSYTTASCEVRQNIHRFGGFPGIPKAGVILR